MKNFLKVEHDTAKKKLKMVNSIHELHIWKSSFLGKRSTLTQTLASLKTLPPEQKLVLAKEANHFRRIFLHWYQEKKKQLIIFNLKATNSEDHFFDPFLPNFQSRSGYFHYLYLVSQEIKAILFRIGYKFTLSPIVTTVEDNFDGLNIPDTHPARGTSDTFYLRNNSNLLLRTHCTSNTLQILRKLNATKKFKHNYAYFTTGDVFRNDDSDATHSLQFQQIDGFLVGPNVNFRHLKWTLKYLCQSLFGPKTEIRLRSSFFPFTSPSVEVDIKCFKCQSQLLSDPYVNCSFCKKTRFIEILGAGMINPLIYKHAGFKNWTTIQGFAFGFGIDRIAMLKYKITDIRYFYENHQAFLEFYSKSHL